MENNIDNVGKKVQIYKDISLVTFEMIAFDFKSIKPLSPLLFCFNYIYLNLNIHPFPTLSPSLKSSLIISVLTDLPSFLNSPIRKILL